MIAVTAKSERSAGKWSGPQRVCSFDIHDDQGELIAVMTIQGGVTTIDLRPIQDS